MTRAGRRATPRSSGIQLSRRSYLTSCLVPLRGVIPDRLASRARRRDLSPDRLRGGGLADLSRRRRRARLLLGREIHGDFDFTTDALPDEIEALVGGWADAVWTQGKRFGTIGARNQGRLIEITTHRAEAYRPDSRKPDVEFADAVEADLSRRDFTVNAMALALPGLELIDPFGGAADLAARRLRAPLAPAESFT